MKKKWGSPDKILQKGERGNLPFWSFFPICSRLKIFWKTFLHFFVSILMQRTCADDMRKGHAQRTCAEDMRRGHAQRTCAEDMRRGHAQRTCAEDMRRGHAQRTCAEDMRRGHAQRTCAEDMRRGHAQRTCAEDMRRGHAQSFHYSLLHLSGSFAFRVSNFFRIEDNPRKI